MWGPAFSEGKVNVQSGRLAGRWIVDWYPRRHIIVEWSREKFSLQWSQCMVLLYDWSCLSAIMEVSPLWTIMAVEPMPPDVKNTNGEKDPRSISLTRSS